VATTGELLSESTVGDYVSMRGLARASEVGAATRLSGGVSKVVLRVAVESGDLVVKQALGKLAVADAWYAHRSRAQNEAAALSLLGRISPRHVPSLLDDDPARCALTVSAAPRTWTTWKSLLLRGEPDPEVAAALGRILATWHATTRTMDLDERFHNRDVFRQIRIRPYFETSARRCPELAGIVMRTARSLEQSRDCLVIGDFSPKNVLVGADQNELWVIDLEVAHCGDPSFDVAFMATHLLLKVLHVTAARDRLHACLHAFAKGYGDGPGVRDVAHLRSVMGCLLLARVVGSSPVEYLTPQERHRVRAAAGDLLRGAAGGPVWWEAVEW